MTFSGLEVKLTTEKGVSVERSFLSYRCPKPSCPTTTITFKENSGFQNPYAHLRSCYGRGKPIAVQKALLDDMYEEAKNTALNAGGSISKHFNSGALSEYEKAMNRYIRLIAIKRFPICHVVDTEFRAVSRYECPIDAKTIRGVILSLVQLVEDRLKEALAGTKGALLFDGWTSHGTHYVAMIASYCEMVTTMVDGEERKEYVSRLALLAASPMAHVPEDDDSVIDAIDSSSEDEIQTVETAVFNAKTHLQFFRDNFKFFGLTFEDWCVCLISDNCSTNQKIATDCKKPMVGCYNHKLNLEVNEMISSAPDLTRVVQKVHRTIKAAKSRLRNSSMLRNMTHLRPLLPNATRWSGKCAMVNRFVRIRTELIAVSSHEKCDLPIDASARFAEKATACGRMLKEINTVTKVLQTRSRSLTDCRQDIIDLQTAILVAADKPEQPLYNCKLGEKFIGTKSHLVTDADFESGVIKIQAGCPDELTDAEKTAVQCLKSDHAEAGSADGSSNGEYLSMKERLAKRRKITATNRTYIPCNFILGSVAEVERVWSIAKHLLHGDIRTSLTPLLFEALIFLRCNERFWDAELVALAITHARTERMKSRIAQLEEEVTVAEEDSDSE